MNQRNSKEIDRINNIFKDLGFQPPEAPTSFSRPLDEIKTQLEVEQGEDARTSRPEFKRCPTTDKVCFPSQDAADRSAKRRQETSPTGFLRTYQCPDCHAYHLTSRRPRKDRRK
jgi:hypothetical protein